MNVAAFRFSLLPFLVISLVACTEDDPVATPTADSGAAGDTEADAFSDSGSDAGVDMDSSGGSETCAADCAALAACDGDSVACGDALNAVESACASLCASSPDYVSELAALGCGAGDIILVEGAGLGEECRGETCPVGAGDFVPGADDTWPTCNPDSGEYATFEPNVSTIARVAGYEQIADLLWEREGLPSSEDFLAAREIYATDEGLASRITRREDEHYPPVTDGDGNVLLCRDEGVPELDPDRCVGPAQIAPLINAAFVAGIEGDEPAIQAARIDAALLWFLALSTHKEAITCTQVRKDCDSSWAYYTGGTQADEQPLGLARLVNEASEFTHQRTFNGVLAVRCWRDNDTADEATDLATRDRAVAQLDAALDAGLARIISARVARMTAADADTAAPDWAWLQVLGPALDRAVRNIDAGAADALQAEWAKNDPNSVDTAAIIDALTLALPCP